MIEYTVRRSQRARRVRVAVDPERGVEVVLPQRAPKRAAAEAVKELRPWIERRLEEAEAARAVVAARKGSVPFLALARRTPAPPGGRALSPASACLIP